MPEQQDGADLLVQAMRQAFEDTFEQDQPSKDDPAPPQVEDWDRD